MSGVINPRVERYFEQLGRGQGPLADPGDQPSNDELLEQALTTLEGTSSGGEVASFLRSASKAGDITIKVMDDGDYYRQYPGTGGIYNRLNNNLIVPRISLMPANDGATFLAHEGQHAMDDADAPPLVIDRLLGFAKALPAAVSGLVQLRNPLGEVADRYSRNDHVTEVNGYSRQAEVAIELGENQYGWNLGYAKDGTVVPRDQLADIIEEHPLYAYSQPQRLVTTLVPGLLGVLGISMGGAALLGKLPATQHLGKNARSGIAAGVGLAAVGALMAQDQIAYSRRLDAIRKKDH